MTIFCISMQNAWMKGILPTINWDMMGKTWECTMRGITPKKGTSSLSALIVCLQYHSRISWFLLDACETQQTQQNLIGSDMNNGGRSASKTGFALPEKWRLNHWIDRVNPAAISRTISIGILTHPKNIPQQLTVVLRGVAQSPSRFTTPTLWMGHTALIGGLD